MTDYVLVVDDEAAIRKLLIRWLEGWGCLVRQAVSANDAIEQMTQYPASILLTDLMMPVNDGIWLTEQVRARWPSTAIIVASGMGDLATAQTLRKHGALDFVMKPLGRELVRQALDRARSSMSAPSPDSRIPAPVVLDEATPATARPGRRVKLLDRRDTPLGIALVVGMIMIFHQPLRFLFDVASDLERHYHLDLIPALTVFGVVFGFHQYRKQQDARYARLVAEGEARRAAERVEDLERLNGFGRHLADAVTLDMIKPVLWEYLPAFGAGRECWILLRSQNEWHMLLGTAAEGVAGDRRERRAERATARDVLPAAHVEGVLLDEHVCYPIVASNRVLGVLGIPASGLTSGTARRRLGAVTALIAIAVKNARLYQESQDKGMRDSLTRCFNRGYAVEALEAELRRAKRSRLPLSVLTFDIDHFKQINDRQGHAAGDRVLIAVTQQLQNTVRVSDIKCRLGGDEFLVILPDTDLTGSVRVAENLRVAVSHAVVPSLDGERVTISTGVATAEPGDLTVESLLARADAALYQAKNAGRNCVARPAHASVG